LALAAAAVKTAMAMSKNFFHIDGSIFFGTLLLKSLLRTSSEQVLYNFSRELNMTFFKKFIGIFFLLVLAGCETTPKNTNESPECRRAKGIYSMCYGNCLSSTPGGMLAAASRCGNVCRNQVIEMSAVCR
jgi:hypothetical protein